MSHRLPPALRLRSFALLWTSSLASGFALQVVVVAIGWQVYNIHLNPLDLGLVGLAEFVPLLILALPAGQIADQFPRRTVVAIGLAFQVVIAALLVLITLSGARQLWPFLTVAVIAGIASALTNPAGRALTPTPPAVIATTPSRSNPPANTDARCNTVRSSSSSRSYDHCTA